MGTICLVKVSIVHTLRLYLKLAGSVSSSENFSWKRNSLIYARWGVWLAEAHLLLNLFLLPVLHRYSLFLLLVLILQVSLRDRRGRGRRGEGKGGVK